MPILGSFSSLSARGFGFNTQSISADANVTPTNLTEGTQITVTVNTVGIADGTILYYTISGSLGTITAADFTDNSLSGSFIINNNTGSFTKTVASDGVVEDGEAFVVEIRQDSITGLILDTTTSVYVQGAQSTGVVRIQPTINGVEFWDFAANGNLILDAGTATSYTFTAATNLKFKAFIWGQGGSGPQSGLGGYSYGTFNLTTNDSLYMRLNYGSGSAGSGSGGGSGQGQSGGGLAGIFASPTIDQSNARLIAGGGGGGAGTYGSSSGGNGGGPSGSSGQNSSNSQISSTGGGGGSQSSGGSGGTASGSYTKTTTTTDNNSLTEGGIYHERSGGVNTVFNVSGQVSATHTNTFDYNYTFNTPYNNSSYSVSASNVSSYTNIAANGAVVPAGFYSVVDNKSSSGFRIRWYRNDDNSQVNVRYHSISCLGQRSVTTSQTISVSANGSSGSALQGGAGGSSSTGFGANNAVGGGGGGAGYYGGGGGAGGNDYGDSSRAASGGGGGAGYVHPSVVNGFTGGYSSGSSHPDRGNAGDAGQNSRIVLQGIFAFEYKGLGTNETYYVNVPATATSMTAKVWASGGAGTGESCGGPYSGGSGGYVQGTIPVTSGSSVEVYVGASGLGSPVGQSGYGAGRGGEFSRVVYGPSYLIAGGGGGAGQAGNGGYGGGNGSGGSGTSYTNSAYIGQGGTQSGGGSGGSGLSGAAAGGGGSSLLGGSPGGTGTNQGNRGGGGGSGYFGGGGGGGSGSGANCQSGGGGGGSGIIFGSWTNTASYNGQTGTSGGRSATNSGDENYVPGYGGSSQNGLVVLIFE